MTRWLVAMALTVVAQGGAPALPMPGPGVSEALARERSAVIRDLRYELTFTIPAQRRDLVQGQAVVRFSLPRPHRIVLDFQQPRDRVRSVRVGGRDVDASFADGHILIPEAATTTGVNEIAIAFVAGDEALNRNDEFLYTLFVPARAQLAFPCFDQPDLKARYTLSLSVPDGWQAVSNGSGLQASGSGVRFAETSPLPTYLFSFVAGRFSVETATRNGRTFRMFHRETDAAKVARNRDTIFDLHAASLAWLEDYTAIPYAFGKFDFVLIPSFQFGGMEHAGAILYNQAGLMLDESATQNQLLERASVIAHETSHMWFGDLVTMAWFNDVWMKEVFANFMAAKIVNPSFPQVNHDLRFLLAHYPAAYQVDRTHGTNPIRQTLGNLSDAGQMYGPIIYQKAPIVMRQLETVVGESAFRDGLREYLKRYAFGNATWLDLVGILDARTPENISAWSRAWVEERGRPEFTTSVRVNRGGRLAGISLTQRDPFARPAASGASAGSAARDPAYVHRSAVTWPQRLTVSLGYAGRITQLVADVKVQTTTVPGAAGLARPLYVLPNGAGLGYGLFVLDDASRDYLLRHVEDVPDALTRGAAWVTLWDNVLEARVAPAAFLDAAMRAVPAESDEQNAQRILAYMARVFWRFLPPAERTARGAALESTLRAGLAAAPSQSRKAAWFNAYRDVVLSPGGAAWLERVWRREERVPGLTFAEPDEIAMALELAVREVPGWDRILTAQLERTQNPDRKARFAFVMPALSADPTVREQAFERFRDVANRRREPWVLESLQYLNHPLREAHARRFVRPVLDMLREIQRTGDIFFPTRWMESTLWGHRSADVAATVSAFLDTVARGSRSGERSSRSSSVGRDSVGNPDVGRGSRSSPAEVYPERLRWTILSAADELFRAAR